MMATETERLRALQDAFRNWPRLPSQLALRILGTNGGDFSKDWGKGKEMQWQVPDSVDFECNTEIGAGYWDRITGGAWRHFVPGHIESLDERSEQPQT